MLHQVGVNARCKAVAHFFVRYGCSAGKMKISLSILILVLLVVAAAFAPRKGLDAVITALNSGNAAELGRYMDEQVELGLPGKTATYSRMQAVSLLKDFFAQNSVRSFEAKHQGDNGDKQFCIGVLHTRNGAYRTRVLLHSKDGRQLVRLVSFQAD